DRLRVLDCLTGLPLTRRNGRVVVEGEDELVVRVDDVNQDAVVLRESGIVGDNELVMNVERTPEWRLLVAQGHGGSRYRRCRRFFLSTTRPRAGEYRERADSERARSYPGTQSQ